MLLSIEERVAVLWSSSQSVDSCTVMRHHSFSYYPTPVITRYFSADSNRGEVGKVNVSGKELLQRGCHFAHNMSRGHWNKPFHVLKKYD